MKYYVIWIEGLNSRTGEKVKALVRDSHTYTHLMTEALRVKEPDVPDALELLREQGCADWALKTAAVRVTYAPKGTIWRVSPNTKADREALISK
jgi:hypothetical protein